MAHNVKIPYYARENTKMLPHSFYAQPLPHGTYGFDELCELASQNTSIEAHTIRAAVLEYSRAVKRVLCDGFRAEVGQKLITLGPGLTAKVKDEVGDDGTVKHAATADELTAVGAKSRVTATVNPEFSAEFARTVRWMKTDRKGNPLEADEDDATLDPDDPQNQGGGGTGGTTPSSPGDNEGD